MSRDSSRFLMDKQHLINQKTKRRGQSQVSFPNLEMSGGPSEGRKYAMELPAGQNFARKHIERSSQAMLSPDDADGQENTRMRKQLKYMATKFRKQIFRINDNLNVRVPSQIQQQARKAETNSRIKTEILKRPKPTFA